MTSIADTAWPWCDESERIEAAMTNKQSIPAPCMVRFLALTSDAGYIDDEIHMAHD